MRIAMVAPGYVPDLGGVETVVTELSRALTRLGVDVEVWAHGRGDRPSVGNDGGVVVRRFPTRGSARYPVSRDLWRHTVGAAHGFDLVHGHSFHSVAALGLTRTTGAPLVFTPHYHGVGHTSVAQVLHAVYRPMGRRLVDGAGAVVAVSNAEADLLRRDFPAVTNRMRVVHHGVDVGRIAAAAPFAEALPVAVVLGRLETYKRVDQVIEAFHRVTRSGSLVIIGDGPDRPRLEALAAAGPRAADVRFRGRLDQVDVDRWLRTARVVVNMSEREAFGLVAWEGAAAGATVLVSPISAHREVAASAAGHIRVCDPRELPPALEELLGQPSRPPAVVRSWEDAAYEHLAVYDFAMRRQGALR